MPALCIALVLCAVGCRRSPEPADAASASVVATHTESAPPSRITRRAASAGGSESSPSGSASGIRWLGSLDGAITESKRLGKPILAVCFFRDVGGSTELRTSAFHAPEVEALASRCVCVLVDLEAQPKLGERLRIRTAPTILLLDSAEHPLARQQGFGSPEQLTRTLREGLRAAGVE